MTETFGERLATTFASRGQLCVGIDPHGFLLREWGLADDVTGVREFAFRTLDAVDGRAGIVKPQVAFFERFGSSGFAVLEELVADARSRGILVIADVKRGDLGTSVDAYASAWLQAGSPLEVDAMTVVAYQGFGSLAGPATLAEAGGKGLFVLGATSNPEGVALQRAVHQAGARAGSTVAAGIVADVGEWNGSHRRSVDGLGSIGLVLGATVDLDSYGIDLTGVAAEASPILAPGFGHQGVALGEMAAIYGPAARQTIVSASRSISVAGPDGLGSAIDDHVREVGAWNG